MKAYGDYFDNNLAEDKYDESGVNKALEELPKIAQTLSMLLKNIYKNFNCTNHQY